MKRRVLLYKPSLEMVQALESIPGFRAAVDLVEGIPGRPLADQARDGGAEAMLLDCEALGHETKRIVADTLKATPVPIVLLCDYTRRGPEVVIDALTEGALDFAESPVALDRARGRRKRECDVLSRLELATARPGRATAIMRSPAAVLGDLPLVVVGVSTGGPSALETLISGLPGDLPAALLVVQHMPPHFTTTLAERLGKATTLPVREAREGDAIAPRQVLIAPGGSHLEVGARGRIQLIEPEGETRFVPSIDLAMVSAARNFGGGVIGVLLTGMGKDGILGLRAVRMAGGRTLAQDEASSVLYGMPKAAADLGLADSIVPLEQIAGEIERQARRLDRVLRKEKGG